MLPVHEFYEAYDRYYRRARWVFHPLLLVAMLWPPLILNNLFRNPDGWLPALLRPHLPSSLISLAGIAVWVVLAAPAVAFVFWLFARLARRDSRLVCPHCERGLARAFPRVVATRACPGCEREILVDPFPAEPVPLSRQEAETRANRWQRARRWGTCELGVFMFAIGGFMALTDEGVIPEGDVAATTLIGGSLAWVVWWIVRGERRRRSQQIPCPRCGASQEPTFVAKFGRCSWCSQPLVADTPAEPVESSTA